MGIQELLDRYLDIYGCGSNDNRLLRCSIRIRIHPFVQLMPASSLYNPCLHKHLQMFFRTPNSMHVWPLIFRAHFCAAIKIELLTPILFSVLETKGCGNLLLFCPQKRRSSTLDVIRSDACYLFFVYVRNTLL